MLLHLLLREVSHDMRLWYERVPSYSNPSDGPSRGSFIGLAPGNNVEVSVEDILSRLTSMGEDATAW